MFPFDGFALLQKTYFLIPRTFSSVQPPTLVIFRLNTEHLNDLGWLEVSLHSSGFLPLALFLSICIMKMEHDCGNMAFENCCDSPPLTQPHKRTHTHLFFHPLPKQSHNIQVNMTAEAQQPFHTANVQSRPKRPDESNLIPQISLSLSLDYKPHESTAKIT